MGTRAACFVGLASSLLLFAACGPEGWREEQLLDQALHDQGHRGSGGTTGGGEAGKLGGSGEAGKLGGTGGAPCLAAPTGTVSWWHAQGNYNDAVGTNNGMSAGAVTFSPGIVGSGFGLSGAADSYVVVPEAPSLDITGSLSIDAWVNPAVAAASGRIVDKITAFVADGYLLDLQGGLLRMIVANASIQASSPISAGTFTHVAGVFSAGNLTLYVNGTMVADQAVSPSTVPTNSNALHIGADSTGSSLFSGVIDEPRIFNRALSASDVQLLFQQGTMQSCP
jgi:hypothetical protein